MHSKVTVVMVPRERYAVALAALDTLYQNTPPCHVVYVSAATPPAILEELRERQVRYGFELLHTDRMLSPNAARNRGARRVQTPYFAMVDNDSMVQPGWLEALLRCAEETGAAMVGPAVWLGTSEHSVFHMGPGHVTVEDTPNGRVQVKQMYHHNVALEKAAELRRQACSYVEFHTVLVRTSVWQEVGEFDENLLSLHEYIDFGFAAAARNGVTWFEPEAVVRYDPPFPLQWFDLPFFALRWCDAWNEAGHDYYMTKWGYAATRNVPNDCFGGSTDVALRFARLHRRAASSTRVQPDEVNESDALLQWRFRASLFVTVDHEWFDTGTSFEELMAATTPRPFQPLPNPAATVQLTSIDTGDNHLEPHAFLTLAVGPSQYRHWLAVPARDTAPAPPAPVPVDGTLVAAHPGHVMLDQLVGSGV